MRHVCVIRLHGLFQNPCQLQQLRQHIPSQRCDKMHASAIVTVTEARSAGAYRGLRALLHP